MSKPHEHTNKLERGRKTAISENVIMGFIVLEKGIFFGDLQGFANKALFPSLETKLIQGLVQHRCPKVA
jgi:hypothetical protein